MMDQPDSIRQGVEQGASLVALASHNARNGFRLGRRGDDASAGSSSGNACSSQLGGHAACAPLRLPACSTSVHLHLHNALGPAWHAVACLVSWPCLSTFMLSLARTCLSCLLTLSFNVHAKPCMQLPVLSIDPVSPVVLVCIVFCLEHECLATAHPLTQQGGQKDMA